MTPQQFKQRWESSDDGDGITFADMALQEAGREKTRGFSH